MKIDTVALAKAIATIEAIVKNPMVHGTLVALLPSFGLSAEDIAEMKRHHAEYVKWEEEARTRSRP